MIHYTCDCCRRPIDSDTELRYVVRLEVYASLEPGEDDLGDDRDYLEEVQEILERLEQSEEEELTEDIYQQQRFDLCQECRRKFVKNPLGRHTTHQLDFSQN